VVVVGFVLFFLKKIPTRKEMEDERRRSDCLFGFAVV
jgi:hypothetical protein